MLELSLYAPDEISRRGSTGLSSAEVAAAPFAAPATPGFCHCRHTHSTAFLKYLVHLLNDGLLHTVFTLSSFTLTSFFCFSSVLNGLAALLRSLAFNCQCTALSLDGHTPFESNSMLHTALSTHWHAKWVKLCLLLY